MSEFWFISDDNQDGLMQVHSTAPLHFIDIRVVTFNHLPYE